MKHILKLKGSGFILDFYSKEKGQTLQGEKGIKISQVNPSTLRSYRIVLDSNRDIQCYFEFAYPYCRKKTTGITGGFDLESKASTTNTPFSSIFSYYGMSVLMERVTATM